MPTRTGAQIIWECLVNEEVHTVFGYPGGAILPAYDAMLDYPVRHVLVRHEQGATHMADGFARAGGGVGVAMATSGPGATNMVTGIATAMMDSSPIVCITGQVPGKLIGYDAFQETDITGITLPITKHSYLVTRAEDIMPAMKEAFHLAKSGRPGPVLVDITKDAQQASVEWMWDPRPVQMRGYRSDLPVTREDLARAAALIRGTRRPVILVGQGVIQSGATRELLALAERIDAPIAMTLLGLGGVPASHPLNLGMMGMHGEAWVNHAIQEADLLLAFGMRFDDRVTGNVKTYAPHAKKIHVDIDPSEINKNVRADAAIVADLRETLVDLLDVLEPADHEGWLAHIDGMKGDAAVRDIQKLPDTGHLYAAHVINDIWRITGGNAVVVTDVGQHQMWEAQYYHHEVPRSLITSGGLGTMGFALPAAIGAKIARPDAEVWAIVGDGGFQMTQAELATAAQEGIKINVAIINNGYLGMVRQWQEFFYERRYAATPLRSPDFLKIADAHGLEGFRAEKRSQVNDVVERARAADGTALIDFRVEQEDSVYPMVPAGADLHAMIRRPERTVLAETGADPV
ncbi:MAG: acetolactate synthase, large subunit, biosynthetic type [Acidobacteria bacterium RIFCSPLOWO2_02_FULL_68_18]|nr:MAG: acetolactate synthase, large subunit, biosynthetic type [Acidobacteria bacterium RIFCSPLOWO2_02_FULL_68_18]OFW50202.1 MAG: acetolactate synthase, large subunit, biosynthetic type [Acidobacteria bacterium RIFCSPLOWO2_12_FULL_68_19]